MSAPNNALRNERHPESLIPYVDFPRRPLSTDIRHPQNGKIYKTPYLWRVRKGRDGVAPATGSEGELWYLEDITANVADWKQFSFGGSSPGIDTVTGDDGVAVSDDGSGNINFNGVAVANATNAKPIYFDGDTGTFTQDLEVQVAAAVTGAPGDKLDAGLASFNDTQFNVDADGYVSLVGGGAAVDGIIGDEGSGNVPDGSGNITITGDTVANATHAKPVYVDDTAASASTIDVQVAAAITGAPGDKNDAGLASFDDTSFAVDADGYVTLAGGDGPALLNIGVDTNTGPGTNPVVPDGTGKIIISGQVKDNGTNSTPVKTHSRNANRFDIEVQVATAIASAPGNKNDAGLASFDSGDFDVDTDGFVQSKNGPLSRRSCYKDEFETGTQDPESQRIGVEYESASSTPITETMFVIGGDEMEFITHYKLDSGPSFTNANFIGLTTNANASLASVTGGIYFFVDSGSSNWQFACKASGTASTTDSGTAYDANWVELKFVVNAAASSVEFFIDGTSEGTISTNIPSATDLGFCYNVDQPFKIDFVEICVNRATT